MPSFCPKILALKNSVTRLIVVLYTIYCTWKFSLFTFTIRRYSPCFPLILKETIYQQDPYASRTKMIASYQAVTFLLSTVMLASCMEVFS
jgi:hypothetical protein